ncbi:MAG: hypothetical protein ACPGR7_10550 [Flavobacteriaceae bacterium]
MDKQSNTIIKSAVINAEQSKVVSNFKIVTLILFILILLFDVAFVFWDGYPTISHVIVYLRPAALGLAFLIGLFINNVFFQRSIKGDHPRRNIIVLLVATLILTSAGIYFYVQNLSYINATNFQEEIPKLQTPLLLDVDILEPDPTTLDFIYEQEHLLADIFYEDYINHDFQTNMSWKANYKVRRNFTTPVFLMVLILGIYMGNRLWPKEKKL